MDIYFIKATKHGQFYKLSDFYNGTNFKLDPTYKLDVNLKADNLTSIVLPNGLLFDPRNFTHVIAPDMDIIYKINRYDYENSNQLKLFLEEDAFISNYHNFITKDIYINRSNRSSLFTGLHDVKDIAIKHNATYQAVSKPNYYTGLWIMYTFQRPSTDIIFTFKDFENIPLLEGNFTTLSNIKLTYPDVTTTDPYSVDYYLKFVKLTNNDLYQAVFTTGKVEWIKIQTPFPYKLQIANITGFEGVAKTNDTIVVTGDVDTINISFPLDATLSGLVRYFSSSLNNNPEIVTSIPTFYNIDGFNNADALISVKVVPQEMIIEPSSVQSYLNISKLKYYELIPPSNLEYVMTSETYNTKLIQPSDIYFKTRTESDLFDVKITSVINKQFKNIFEFAYPSENTMLNTEPFNKYFLSFYGEVIQIPTKYLSDFKIRIAIVSTDVLYEVYTDKYNVIASGRLQWFARYSVDQLNIFMANNPTYKEQFWTNQIAGAIKNIGLGAVGGTLSAGPGLGTAIGVASSIVSIASNITNLHYMEKGYKDKADEIRGQNDLAMALVRGYGVYLIKVTPETNVKNQMIETFNLIGFPCGTKLKPNTIITSGNNVIAGRMLEVVKNNYVTNEINKKIAEGVVIEL